MDIKRGDDIDELFSELTKAPKPEYIRLALSEYASSVGPFGEYKILQSISTSQLEYNEQQRIYFVDCVPFQPFMTDVIRHWDASTFPQLKLALVSATTDKVAIMHVSGVEVLKQAVNMTNLVSIDFVLDKEHNSDAINSTGIRMKMNVLVDEFEMSDLFKKKRKDTIKYTHNPYVGLGGAITTTNAYFHDTPKSDVTRQCDDAVTRALSQRIKEIEDQKTAKAEDEMSYKAIFSALTDLSKMDSSLGTLDANDLISKFLSL